MQNETISTYQETRKKPLPEKKTDRISAGDRAKPRNAKSKRQEVALAMHYSTLGRAYGVGALVFQLLDPPTTTTNIRKSRAR